MNARMKTDIILATIAGMAETLEPHFPQLALGEVHKSAVKALSKWPAQVKYGRKGVRYMKKVGQKLAAFEGANVFRGATIGGIINFWIAILETLHGETKRKREKILADLQELLREYAEHLKFDQEKYIEEGLRYSDRFFEIIEKEN